MLEEYDIDRLNPRPNPYAKELNRECKLLRDFWYIVLAAAAATTPDLAGMYTH